jgi:hypothetical protein
MTDQPNTEIKTMRGMIFVTLAIGAIATPSYAEPKTTQDIVQIADTLGLRTGMTLAEARQRVTALTGVVQEYDNKTYRTMHNGYFRGPNPAYFVRGVAVGAGVGPNSKLEFMHPLDSSRSPIYVSVFPKDPRADYRDENNLIIYYIASEFEFKMKLNSGGTMPIGEFRDAVNRRYGPFKAGRSTGPCSADSTVFVGAEKMASLKSVGGETQADMRPQTVVEARKCKLFQSLEAWDIKGQVSGGAIIRYDFALAEQAYNNLTQVVGHDAATKAVADGQRAAKAARAAQN